MSEPSWLTRAEVERVQEKVVDAAGGSYGLRDSNLLESALARPLNLYAYGERDIFQLAASYAEGISRNHAFIDGNKRTAWTASEVFLLKHGKYIQGRSDDVHVDFMEQLGQGKIDRNAAADYLRSNSRERQQARSQSETEKDDIARTWGNKKSERKTDEPSLENSKDKKATREQKRPRGRSR